MRYLLFLVLLVAGCGGQILKISQQPDEMDEETWRKAVERDRLLLNAVTTMATEAFRKAADFMNASDRRLWCEPPRSQYELAKLANGLVKEGFRQVSVERNLEAGILYYGRVVQIARTWSIVMFDLGWLLFRKGVLMRFQARRLLLESEGKKVDSTGRIYKTTAPPPPERAKTLASRARVLDDLAVKFLTQAYYQFKNCYDARFGNDPEPLRFMGWTLIYLNNLRAAYDCFKQYLQYPLKPDRRKRVEEYLATLERVIQRRAEMIPRYRPERQLRPRRFGE